MTTFFFLDSKYHGNLLTPVIKGVHRRMSAYPSHGLISPVYLVFTPALGDVEKKKKESSVFKATPNKCKPT